MQQFLKLGECTVRNILYCTHTLLCVPYVRMYVCTYLAECKNGHPFAVTEVSIKQNCN